jgi:rhomboid protease GluP
MEDTIEITKDEISDPIADQMKSNSSALDQKLTVHFKIGLKDLVPNKKKFITPILIYLNILIFIAMILSGVHFLSPETLSIIKWGGNSRLVTLHGEYWRVITSMFLNYGFFHLIFNIYSLFYIGTILEQNLNKWLFLFTFFATGIFAGLFSLIFNDVAISVGTSGAVFGLFGLLIAFLVFKKIKFVLTKNFMFLINTLIIITLNIVLGLLIDGNYNAVYLGSLISGFLIGTIYILTSLYGVKKYITYSSVSGLLVILSIITFMTVKDIDTIYLETTTDIRMNEMRSIWLYRIDAYKMYHEKSDLIKKINQEGVELWKENIDMIDHLMTYHYNEETKEGLSAVKEYCMLNLDFCKMLIKFVENEDPDMVPSINEKALMIASKKKEISGFFNY